MYTNRIPVLKENIVIELIDPRIPFDDISPRYIGITVTIQPHANPFKNLDKTNIETDLADATRIVPIKFGIADNNKVVFRPYLY